MSESRSEAVEPVRTGKPAGWRAKKAEERKKRGTARKRGQRPTRRSKLVREEGGQRRSRRVKPSLNRARWQSLWDAEQLDRHLASRWRTRIASEPLCPREARVRALRAGKDHFRFAWRSGGRRRQAHFDALVSHELHTGAPVCSPAPIAPEQRGGTNPERMQQHADLARLCGRAAIPLTLLAQRTGATVRMLAAYTTRRLPSASGAARGRNVLPAGQRSVPSGWRVKSCPEKRPAFQGGGHGGRAIALMRELAESAVCS